MGCCFPVCTFLFRLIIKGIIFLLLEDLSTFRGDNETAPELTSNTKPIVKTVKNIRNTERPKTLTWYNDG